MVCVAYMDVNLFGTHLKFYIDEVLNVLWMMG